MIKGEGNTGFGLSRRFIGRAPQWCVLIEHHVERDARQDRTEAALIGESLEEARLAQFGQNFGRNAAGDVHPAKSQRA